MKEKESMSIADLLEEVGYEWQKARLAHEDLIDIENEEDARDVIVLLPNNLDLIISSDLVDTLEMRAEAHNSKCREKRRSWKEKYDTKLAEFEEHKRNIKVILDSYFGEDFCWYPYKTFFSRYSHDSIEDFVVNCIWAKVAIILEMAYRLKELEMKGKNRLS